MKIFIIFSLFILHNNLYSSLAGKDSFSRSECISKQTELLAEYTQILESTIRNLEKDLRGKPANRDISSSISSLRWDITCLSSGNREFSKLSSDVIFAIADDLATKKYRLSKIVHSLHSSYVLHRISPKELSLTFAQLEEITECKKERTISKDLAIWMISKKEL
jgi:hypothetical protein